MRLKSFHDSQNIVVILIVSTKFAQFLLIFMKLNEIIEMIHLELLLFIFILKFTKKKLSKVSE